MSVLMQQHRQCDAPTAGTQYKTFMLQSSSVRRCFDRLFLLLKENLFFRAVQDASDIRAVHENNCRRHAERHRRQHRIAIEQPCRDRKADRAEDRTERDPLCQHDRQDEQRECNDEHAPVKKRESITAPTSTPLPPLKPKYSGNMWPRITKIPAVSLPTGPPSAQPTETAAAPLAMSPSRTNSVFFSHPSCGTRSSDRRCRCRSCGYPCQASPC